MKRKRYILNLRWEQLSTLISAVQAYNYDPCGVLDLLENLKPIPEDHPVMAAIEQFEQEAMGPSKEQA